MKKYLIYFYIGTLVLNPFIRPVVKEVEILEGIVASENEIILEGLKQFEKYPRTYYARVEELG